MESSRWLHRPLAIANCAWCQAIRPAGYRAARRSSPAPAPRTPRCAWRDSPSMRSLDRVEKPSAAHAVLLQFAAEVILVGFEMRVPVWVGEVVEVVGLGRVDASQQRRLARIADRSRRESCVGASVERDVELQLRLCRLG